MMIFKRAATNRGFTLVELLLVIVLIAILMAIVTLSGFNMVTSANAQTEVRRVIRTVHALRSAWLACYADTQKMVGVPEGVSWPQTSIDRELRRYADRNLDDEEKRYGKINIKAIPSGSRNTYIGFDGTGDIWSKSPAMSEIIMKSLETQADDYGLYVAFTTTSKDVYIRIK